MKTKTIACLALSITLLSFIFPFKPKPYTPPGTMKISSNIFFDATELNNISWQEYMYWNEIKFGKSSLQYLATLPDSNVWANPSNSFYLKHPEYRNYPVVGISWQQANQFCAWRSDRVMEQITINKIAHPNKEHPSQIEYRLPSIREWEQVAEIGYSEKTIKTIAKKHSSCTTGNFKSETDSDVTHTTSPVYQYWPNENEIYNLRGNVAEMTNEKGIAKGGSWNQLEKDVNIHKNFKYSQPENWIGFRCICEITF